VVDADGNTVDLSLPQPESDGAEPEESEGDSSDGPVTAESETEEEPAS